MKYAIRLLFVIDLFLVPCIACAQNTSLLLVEELYQSGKYDKVLEFVYSLEDGELSDLSNRDSMRMRTILGVSFAAVGKCRLADTIVKDIQFYPETEERVYLAALLSCH